MPAVSEQISGDEASSRMRAYGLGRGQIAESDEPPPPSAEEADEDAEEAEETEAESSEESEQSAAPSEKPAQEEELEKAADEPKTEKAPKRISKGKLAGQLAAANALIQKQQSRLDKQDSEHKRQMLEMWEKINTLESQPRPQHETDDDLDLGDDSDLVDVKTLKKMLTAKQKQAAKSEPSKKPGVGPKEQGWLRSQDDYSDVAEYIQKAKLADSPDFTSIPTDTVGLYGYARAAQLEAKIEKMQAEQEKLLASARAEERKKMAQRPKIPPTGGEGRRTSASAAPLRLNLAGAVSLTADSWSPRTTMSSAS